MGVNISLPSDFACEGTGALTQCCPKPVKVKVGALGLISLDSGYYIYIGSAFGPGGLAARLRHHVAGRSRPRWHLDYLRPYLEPMSAWVSLSHRRAEHYWARALSELDPVVGVIWRFGCTDCRCPSHLFFATTDPSYSHVRWALGQFKDAPLRRVDLRLFENIAAHV